MRVARMLAEQFLYIAVILVLAVGCYLAFGRSRESTMLAASRPAPGMATGPPLAEVIRRVEPGRPVRDALELVPGDPGYDPEVDGRN